MQARPHARLGPVPQPAPGRHPGAAHRLRRDITPCDTGAQHIHHASECHSVRNAQPPGVAMAPLGSRRQQRGHPFPQGVRDKISTHPGHPADQDRRAQAPATQSILKRSVSPSAPTHGPGSGLPVDGHRGLSRSRLARRRPARRRRGAGAGAAAPGRPVPAAAWSGHSASTRQSAPPARRPDLLPGGVRAQAGQVRAEGRETRCGGQRASQRMTRAFTSSRSRSLRSVAWISTAMVDRVVRRVLLLDA